MPHKDFAILNSHVSKAPIFCGKTEKFKIAVFFPAIYPCI